MALKHFIKVNSYAVADEIYYSKENRIVKFFLTVFEDDQKKDIISRNDYQFIGGVEPTPFLRFVEDRPENAAVGQTFVINSGDPSQFNNNWIITKTDDSWSDIQPAHGHVVIDPSKRRYIYNDITIKWDIRTRGFDASEFSEWFATDKLDIPGHNIIKRIYLYLKTLPEFAGTEDA